MVKYRALAIITKYWMPGEDYLEEIVRNIRGRVANGDFVVVSEKAIATALNNLVDESKIEPSANATFIVKFWIRIIWGYVLGHLCRFSLKLLQNLRNYPLEEGGRHKQVALQYAGFFQALMFGSEGGIDGSNLPYSYVSLPLKDAQRLAEKVRAEILSKLGKKVFVMISDTDKTYSFRNFHFTPRPKPMKGIYSLGGVITYVVGRFFRLKRRATPLAVAGCRMFPEQALQIAEFANRVRGSGAGRTVWDMAEKFGTGLTDVSWKMLKTVKHKPIIIVRRVQI